MQFSLLKVKVRHCKHCAKAVCEPCSQQKRQLSKSDSVKYRICDECDCNVFDNYFIKASYDALISAQGQMIEQMTEQRQQMGEERESKLQEFLELKEAKEFERNKQVLRKQQLEQKLQEKLMLIHECKLQRTEMHRLMADLEQQVSDLNLDISRLQSHAVTTKIETSQVRQRLV